MRDDRSNRSRRGSPDVTSSSSSSASNNVAVENNNIADASNAFKGTQSTDVRVSAANRIRDRVEGKLRGKFSRRR